MLIAAQERSPARQYHVIPWEHSQKAPFRTIQGAIERLLGGLMHNNLYPSFCSYQSNVFGQILPFFQADSADIGAITLVARYTTCSRPGKSISLSAHSTWQEGRICTEN
jgi:hypothetical protein